MATFDKSVTDTVALSDALNQIYVRVKNPGVIDTIALRQSVQYTLIPDPFREAVVDAITLTQSISGNKINPGSSSVAVTQTIDYHINTGRKVTDNLGIQDFVTAYLENKGYNFVDPSIVTYVGTLTAGKVRLVGGTTLEIRKPDFGDKDAYSVSRVKRTSRGGDLQVFQDPMWPTTEILDFKFSYLTPTESTTLLTFITDNLGAKIDLYDQYGRHWKGFIITPESDAIQTKRVGVEISFKFQGVLQ